MVLAGAHIFIRHLQDIIRFVYYRCCRREGGKEEERNVVTIKLLLPCLVTILVTFILSTAGMVMTLEGITYIDSIYYCFISLSTIGFGDFLPLKISEEKNIAKAIGLVAFLFIWVMFGIIIVVANLIILISLKVSTVKVGPVRPKSVKQPRNEVRMDDECEDDDPLNSVIRTHSTCMHK